MTRMASIPVPLQFLFLSYPACHGYIASQFIGLRWMLGRIGLACAAGPFSDCLSAADPGGTCEVTTHSTARVSSNARAK